MLRSGGRSSMGTWSGYGPAKAAPALTSAGRTASRVRRASEACQEVARPDGWPTWASITAARSGSQPMRAATASITFGSLASARGVQSG